jgi:hypothetical protein
MNAPIHVLTLQLLEWIVSRPRTREEVLAAWRTTCPRLSIWEDACIAGLIEHERGIVVVSSRGHSLLKSAHEHHDPR